MEIGDRVKMLREQQGMTQEELAHKLGYKNKSSVAHIEKNRDIPRSMVVQLAEILGTTPCYLMGWEEKESTPIETNRSALTKLLDQMAEPEIDSMIDYAEYLLSKRQSQA
jgi:transcriptional regulator with XRE-family HTH domain